MSDFLSNLIARSFTDAPVIQPRVPSLFETTGDEFLDEQQSSTPSVPTPETIAPKNAPRPFFEIVADARDCHNKVNRERVRCTPGRTSSPKPDAPAAQNAPVIAQTSRLSVQTAELHPIQPRRRKDFSPVDQRSSKSPPIIRVTIGRVEVRAVQSPAPAPKQAKPATPEAFARRLFAQTRERFAMSNYLAVATVTATLQRELQSAIGTDVPGATATTVRPDAPGHGVPEVGVNIFLYEIAPNAALRNMDLPTRSGNGQTGGSAPCRRAGFALPAEFLRRGQHLGAQRVLGSVVRHLHSRPLLTRQDDSGRPSQTAYSYLPRLRISPTLWNRCAFLRCRCHSKSSQSCGPFFFKRPTCCPLRIARRSYSSKKN